MTLHRVGGWVFVAIYIFLMWDMIPRLWSYQIELPARTVVHLTLGIAVGAILIIKVAVVRFFKHMESTLAPFLGTSLLICTLLLTGLALPYTARETYLRVTAQEGADFSADRIARVERFLPEIGLEDEAAVASLASGAGLDYGQRVLVTKCTQCHDLRTILVRPRTPQNWHDTVVRMANRSTTLTTIDESDQWAVTAYLIAISPTLQSAASDSRVVETERTEARAAARQSAVLELEDFDLDAARGVFEAQCSQCHSPSLVESSRLETRELAVSLVTRMVSNGLRSSEEELAQIIGYLEATYAN